MVDLRPMCPSGCCAHGCMPHVWVWNALPSWQAPAMPLCAAVTCCHRPAAVCCLGLQGIEIFLYGDSNIEALRGTALGAKLSRARDTKRAWLKLVASYHRAKVLGIGGKLEVRHSSGLIRG